MTVSEVRDKKQRLICEIDDAIRKFKSETGMEIERISIPFTKITMFGDKFEKREIGKIEVDLTI